MQTQRRSLWRALLPIGCLAAFFAVFTLINFKYMPCFIDGDIYADMELAREIWRQKALFPDNWIYGNQYYTIATPVAAALFYGLTDSMNLSMALATALMSVLILWAFLWMLRPFVKERAALPAAALLFVAAPMADELLLEFHGQLFFTLASYYACYLITLLLVFGDYVRSAKCPEKGFRPGTFVLCLVLSFLSGMQSLRQMLIMALPILALELLRLLLRRSVPGSLVRAGSVFAANALGLGLMKLLAVPTRTIYGEVSLVNEGLGEKLLAAWHSVRGVTGFDAVCFDGHRAFYAVWFAFTLLIAVLGGLRLLKRRKEADGLFRLWLLCLISLGGVLLAGIVLNVKLRSIYLFVWYLVPALSLIPLLEMGEKPRLRAGLLSVLCLLSLGNLLCSYGSSLAWAKSRDEEPAKAFCRDAEAAGIEYVYGDWLTVPHMVVYSDGALTGGCWGDYIFQVRGYINLQGIYAPEDNDRALYAVSDWGLEAFRIWAGQIGARYEVFGQYGDVTVFRTDHQLMFYEGEPMPCYRQTP